MSTWTHAPRYTPEQLAQVLGGNPPTPEQSEVISSALEPMLVIAGAGSGKTATMADRVVWLVANGYVQPDEVLGVTFTRKAAGELAERINGKLEKLAEAGLEIPRDAAEPTPEQDADPDELLLEDGPGRASVSTYHSYANTLVRDHGMRIGIEPDTELIGEAQAYQLAARLARSYEGDLSFLTSSFSTLVSGIMRLAGDCAEHLVAPEQVREHLDRIVEHGLSLPYTEKKVEGTSKEVDALISSLRARAAMADLVAAFQQAKAEAGVMDYGDLVRHAADIAHRIPAVGAAERSRFKVVLLDEFQDTSHAQMVLFRGLYSNGHPVTAVGDPNQSIYGFRGASAGQLFSMPTQFPRLTSDGERAPAAVRHLTVAWRNSLNVLQAANTVAAPLRQTGQEGIELKPLGPSPFAVDGDVRLDWYPDSVTEARAVVASLQAAGRVHLAEQGKPATRAILCRQGSQFPALMDALDDAGVPYEVLGLSGLLAVPEVADLVSVLQVIADPTRSDHLLRILTGPRWRIGPADLTVLAERAREMTRRQTRNGPNSTAADTAVDLQDTSPEEEAESASLIEALDFLPGPEWTGRSGRTLSAEGHSRLTHLRRELRMLSTQTSLDLVTLIRLVERTIGLDVEVAARPGAAGAAARRHLDAFLDAADDFSPAQEAAAGHGTDLAAFLSWLESAEEHEKGLSLVGSGAVPRTDAVQLLTAHASKGLEWDLVAVPGLVVGQFPSSTVDLWTGPSSGHLPWDLRGDRESLPQWDRDWSTRRDWADAAKSWTLKHQKEGYPDAYRDLVAAHQLSEERRLAYVAFTRARTLLLLSGSHWRGENSKPTQRSAFLDELHELAQTTGAATLGVWTEPEDAGETNPFAKRSTAAIWPFDPLNGPEVVVLDPEHPEDLTLATPVPPRSRPRRAAVETAAAWVSTADPLDAASSLAAPSADRPDDGRSPQEAELARQVGWVLDCSTGVGQEDTGAVELPSHLSASAYVDLADDPTALARQLRRPMPRPPAQAARRGTAFHAWVEDRFGATAMLDFEDPQDAADHWVDDSLDLAPMKDWFLGSRWADRVPAAVEAAVETTVGGITLRGRIDAVYRTGGDPKVPFDPEAQWELVDWKTGAVPSGHTLEIRGLQLAVYRLAWSRLHGIPLENISASFVYVAHGTEKTVHHLAGEEELEQILRQATGQETEGSPARLR